jgi:hypothetical protein
MPDVDLGTGKRLTSGNIDDLHRKAKVYALLTGSNVCTLRLTLNPVGSVKRLRCQCTASWIRDRFLIPIEVEKILRIVRMSRFLLVLDSRPLRDSSPIPLDNVYFCQYKLLFND